MAKADSYEIITNAILDQMEKGIIPWQKPWVGSTSTNAPKNIISKKAYSGFNYFMLASVASANNYSSPYWMTFKQAKQKGGGIKAGEKATPVIYWNMIKVEDKDNLDEKGEPKKKTIPILKHYYVFNLDQTKDVKNPDAGKQDEIIEFNPIEQAEAIVNGYKTIPEVKHNEQSAYYNPKGDFINMPDKNSFKSAEEYYSTLFHEMGHSTGHKNRLNRKGVAEFDFFGSHQYSKEELVAEFTACYLCGEAGILKSVQDNSVAYIQSWSKKLQEDKKLIISAVSQATKASDYILGKEKSK
jgi:antirestriction protein ArdC